METQPYSGTVVIDSNAEEIAQLTEKWKKVEKTDQKLSKIGNSGFIITLLSPFDFEGPIAELITAVIAAVGFIMKTTARAKLDDLSNTDERTFTAKDNEELKNIVNSFTNFKK